MKHVLCILYIITTVTIANAQIEMKYENGAVIQHVINIDTASAANLYQGVNRWILKTYTNPDQVVKARLENEEIRGEGFQPNGLTLSEFPPAKNGLRYSFKIEVKDGRVRYTMYDMRGDMYAIEIYIYKKDGTQRTTGQATTVKNSATQVANLLITSLELTLKAKTKSDW